MQICPVSYGYNTSFDAKAKVNLKSGSTAIAEVKHNKDGIIEQISVDIFRNHVNMGSYTRAWVHGITYDTFLKSNEINEICTFLKISNKEESKQILDAVYAAELNESSDTKKDNYNAALYPAIGLPGGFPLDAECISAEQRPLYDL